MKRSWLLGISVFVVISAAILTPQETLVERLRNQEPEPCFGMAASGNLVESMDRWAEIMLEADPKFKHIEAVIPSGPYSGKVIPRWCFAVENQTFGVTYWKRPYVNGELDTTIPAWNPKSASE